MNKENYETFLKNKEKLVGLVVLTTLYQTLQLYWKSKAYQETESSPRNGLQTKGSLFPEHKTKIFHSPVIIISLKVVVKIKWGTAVQEWKSKKSQVSYSKGRPGSDFSPNNFFRSLLQMTPVFLTDLYMSPAERLVVFDRWGLGSPARLMSEESTEEITDQLLVQSL